MKRIKNIFYAIFLAFLFCNPTCAQNNVKIKRWGNSFRSPSLQLGFVTPS